MDFNPKMAQSVGFEPTCLTANGFRVFKGIYTLEEINGILRNPMDDKNHGIINDLLMIPNKKVR